MTEYSLVREIFLNIHEIRKISNLKPSNEFLILELGTINNDNKILFLKFAVDAIYEKQGNEIQKRQAVLIKKLWNKKPEKFKYGNWHTDLF